MQRVKSTSDWSIMVPGALGNTSMHSNDTCEIQNGRRYIGCLVVNYFLSLFSCLLQNKSQIMKNSTG